MKEPLKYVRENILKLQPYSTARDEFSGGEIDVWLDANESPYDNGVNRYPDPRHKKLKGKIAQIKGMQTDTIFIGGAGSDEAIDLTYRIFCNPGKDKALILTPTYGVYSVAAQINDVAVVEVSLKPDFSLPTEKIKKTVDQDKALKLIWLCSPNNPTGNAFDKKDILEIADYFDGILAVDEAYVDFSTKGSLLEDISSHKNIVVLQTFSKAWGMASLRCGVAFAVPEIAAIYNNVKYPYNLNGPTQGMVIEMIDNSPEENIEEIIAQRDELIKALSEISFVTKIHPSDANFLLVEMKEPDKVYDYLVNEGIIVRNRSRVPGCGRSLRITVGTPEENKKLISALSNFEK